MKIAEATWQEIGQFSKEAVVVIPTGSLEQHGAHLPLITDTLIVTAIANAVESGLMEEMLLLPTIWLGASSHHLPFAGSVSASCATYVAGIREVVDNYHRHGFRKFLLLNGHGGNIEPNRIALREAKSERPDRVYAQISYFDLIADEIGQILTGPLKQMRHACEAETSLVLHLKPELVRKNRIRDDGMRPEPAIPGLILNFDELSDEGSVGFATHATAEKGKRLFDAAVEACQVHVKQLLGGFVMLPIPE